MTPQVSLAIGSIVGGRFRVEAVATSLGAMTLYGARDQKTGRPVALWIVPQGALPDAHVEATRRSVRQAATVQHPNLIAPFGTSVLPDGTLVIATEPVGRSALTDVCQARRREGRAHSPVEALAWIRQLLGALNAAHPVLVHGAITPDLMRTEGDTLRLAGLGLLTPLVLLDAVSPRYVAPELRAGQPPTVQSDIYCVGAVLYELLTGRPPNPSIAASEVVTGLPPTLDIVLEQCLSADPDDRFPTLQALENALGAVVSPSMPARAVMASSRPPSALGEDIPVVLDITAADEDGIPVEHDLDDPTDAAREGDLGALLQVATTDDSDRWMFSHEGLDHGPLTARDLIAAIVRGDVLEDDLVVNMDSEDRRKLRDWAQYREFVETANDKRRGVQRQVATAAAIEEAGTTRASKAIIAVASVASLSILGVVYWMTVGPGAHHQRTAAEIDNLIARGELHVQTTSIQLLPPPPPSARTGGHGGGGGGHGGGMSYEAAMSAAIDYNFAGAGPGGGTLSDAEITRPLNANLSRFASCLGDGSARNVTLRIAIGGNGRAMGVTVGNGSAALKGCVSGVVRGLSWRAFGGPRIGLSWGFGF